MPYWRLFFRLARESRLDLPVVGRLRRRAAAQRLRSGLRPSARPPRTTRYRPGPPRQIH